MVADYEIKIADCEFKAVWANRQNVKDQVLSDMTLPICDTIEINKADLGKMQLCELDTLCVRPTSNSVDDMTAICTRVLEIGDQSVNLVVTSTLHPPKHPTIYIKEPEPEEIDVETFNKLLAVFIELQGNPFAVEERLGVNRQTIYTYINHDGTPTAKGQKLLDDSKDDIQ